jgi:transposase
LRGTQKNGDQEQQALGRSRGGFSTKVHIAVDALGNPLPFVPTAGPCHDQSQADELVKDFDFEFFIADKGYDAQDYLDGLKQRRVQIVVPSRSNRKEPREYDKHLYRERHLVECFINKMKHYRRVFSRFEKLSKNYLSFLYFVSSLICLR